MSHGSINKAIFPEDVSNKEEKELDGEGEKRGSEEYSFYFEGKDGRGVYITAHSKSEARRIYEQNN